MKTIVQAKIIRGVRVHDKGILKSYWMILFRFEGENAFYGRSFRYNDQRSAYLALKAHRKGLNRFIPCIPLDPKHNDYTWLCVKER